MSSRRLSRGAASGAIPRAVPAPIAPGAAGVALLVLAISCSSLGALPDRSAECRLDVSEHEFPPQGSFDELEEVAACITAWPEAETERRAPDTPSFLERGWRPEDHEPRGQRVTAVVVRMELQAHQEWLENGSVILSNVVWLVPVEPGGFGGEIAILCEGHPHLAGRPLELGDRLTFVLPPEWPSYDLWFRRLKDLAFAGGPGPEEPARSSGSGAPRPRNPER